MPDIIYKRQNEYLSSLRKQPDPLIKEMEDLAQKKNIPILNPLAADLLEKIVLTKQPKHVLEIGTAIAYSSIKIARLLQNEAIIETIEKSKDNIKLATDFIKRAKLENRINLLQGEALEIMPALDKKYDFIFLDADKRDYEKLFLLALIILKKGGILFIDNLLWHGYAAAKIIPKSDIKSANIIREFNQMFIHHPDIDASIFPVGDGIGIGVKK
jgi:caffeoyl-CoA O-methyltransferase